MWTFVVVQEGEKACSQRLSDLHPPLAPTTGRVVVLVSVDMPGQPQNTHTASIVHVRTRGSAAKARPGATCPRGEAKTSTKLFPTPLYAKDGPSHFHVHATLLPTLGIHSLPGLAIMPTGRKLPPGHGPKRPVQPPKQPVVRAPASAATLADKTFSHEAN